MAQGDTIDTGGNWNQPDNPWQDPYDPNLNQLPVWDWPNNDWTAAPPPPEVGPSPFGPGSSPQPGGPSPSPSPSTPGNPAPGGFLGGYGSPPFNWPKFTGPDLPTITPLNAPAPFTVSPFSYDQFAAPTLEQAQSEPGYAFARQEGQRALENSAAAKGTLRTGGTLKDLIGWGDKFAEQNYGNVYNRAANTYGLNRGNAFDNWSANQSAAAKAYDTNWGTTKDVYNLNTGTSLDLWDRAFQEAVAQFNPQFSSASMQFQDIYNRQRDLLNANTQLAVGGLNS